MLLRAAPLLLCLSLSARAFCQTPVTLTASQATLSGGERATLTVQDAPAGATLTWWISAVPTAPPDSAGSACAVQLSDLTGVPLPPPGTTAPTARFYTAPPAIATPCKVTVSVTVAHTADDIGTATTDLILAASSAQNSKFKLNASQTTLTGGSQAIITAQDAPAGAGIVWSIGATTALCPAVSLVPSPDTTTSVYTAPQLISTPCTVRVTAVYGLGNRASIDLTLAPPGYDYDWGRVRAYFTAGILQSKDQGDFSRSNLFISFNLDKNWAQWGRLRLNTFFDARLTAVPETNTATGTTAAATTNIITTSAKAGSFEGGVYVPVTAARWSFKQSAHSLFIAPLVNIGFATAIETAGAVMATPVHPDRFYKFYGYGLRLGHSRDSRDAGIAPDLVSYIDVVYGRFANFDLLAAGGPDANGYTKTIRPYRYGIEGVLKIPRTPFIIGLSANVSGPTAPGFKAPKDDLRFLFGARFDVGKLFSKLGVPDIN